MKYLRAIIAAFRSYTYADILISVVFVAIFLLMIVKMMIFPYGFFGFGASNIYTEGLVAKNGIQNINPLFVDYNEADREVSSLVFSGLMKYDPNKHAVVDDMAVLTINEKKTEYTFTLRDGLRWHDGKPITVEDVYFTFNDIILHPAFQNEILKTNFAGVKIELSGDKTIKFILEKPNIFFITNLTTGILPKHILENVEIKDLLTNQFNKMPVGSGPYMVTDVVEIFPDGRTQLTLERNPYYYDERSEIELIRFVVYPTMEKLFEEINSVNGVVKLTGDYMKEFVKNERFNLIPYELPQYTAVFMNMESKILKDHTKVRLALQKAVDKEKLISLFSDKKAVDTPLMELNQVDWVYQSSIEQAQGALKDSGFEYNEEDTEHMGIRYNADEEALELNLVARLYEEGTPKYTEVQTVVDYLQEVWEGIGFSIQLDLLAPEEFRQRVASRSYDLLLIGQNLGYNLDTYSYWHSTQADPKGLNLSNYKSFKVDSLIEDIRSVFNEEKRRRQLKEIAEAIKEDVPAVFLYRPMYYYATDGKVSGISMEGVVFPSDRFSTVSQWKFER